jgi:hypothetical protein
MGAVVGAFEGEVLGLSDGVDVVGSDVGLAEGLLGSYSAPCRWRKVCET